MSESFRDVISRELKVTGASDPNTYRCQVVGLKRPLLHILLFANIVGTEADVKWFVQKYPESIVSVDKIGRTALFMCNEMKLVRTLLDAGSDLHHKLSADVRPRTIVGHYWDKGRIDIAYCLLERGADPRETYAYVRVRNYAHTELIEFATTLRKFVKARESCAKAVRCILGLRFRAANNKDMIRLLAYCVWRTRTNFKWTAWTANSSKF